MNKQTQKEKADDVLKRFFTDETVLNDFSAMAGALVYVHDMAESLHAALLTNMALAGVTDARYVTGYTHNLRVIQDFADEVIRGMRKHGLPVARVETTTVPERKTN